MRDNDLAFLSLTELSQFIRQKEISPVDIIEALLARIDHFDERLGSYITVCADAALAQAHLAEKAILQGETHNPLYGLPVVHKDISFTKGVRTTAHSRTMLDFVPTEDATHVRRLAERGMIMLGKTNTTEFACGDMAEFGPSYNPWREGYFSGASSGGSANAVAAGLAIVATGTDTGGSIRAPASMCGVVGVKPSYGRVSRVGITPLSWSMDTVGPMTRTVKDAALMLRAMAGFDPQDKSTRRETVPDYLSVLSGDLKGVRLGIPEQHFYEGLESAVDEALRVALKDLQALGAELRPVKLPMAGELGAAADVLVMAEAFPLHAEALRTRGQDYGPKARRRIVTGAFYSAAEYQQAGQLRELWIAQLDEAMRDLDGLITPTLPFSACSLQDWQETPPDTSWATRHFNLSGHPALTLPCGVDAQGLPIGMQVVSHRFQEGMMFRIANAYQQASSWHLRRPDLEAGDD